MFTSRYFSRAPKITLFVWNIDGSRWIWRSIEISCTWESEMKRVAGIGRDEVHTKMRAQIHGLVKIHHGNSCTFHYIHTCFAVSEAKIRDRNVGTRPPEVPASVLSLVIAKGKPQPHILRSISTTESALYLESARFCKVLFSERVLWYDSTAFCSKGGECK